MVLGAARAWPLAAAILPATWRRWDPHRPAEPWSHVGLRHDAYLFRYIPLMRAPTRTEPAGQPRRQLHAAILTVETLVSRRRQPLVAETLSCGQTTSKPALIRKAAA
jgi:hypothetical protein